MTPILSEGERRAPGPRLLQDNRTRVTHRRLKSGYFSLAARALAALRFWGLDDAGLYVSYLLFVSNSDARFIVIGLNKLPKNSQSRNSAATGT